MLSNCTGQKLLAKQLRIACSKIQCTCIAELPNFKCLLSHGRALDETFGDRQEAAASVAPFLDPHSTHTHHNVLALDERGRKRF